MEGASYVGTLLRLCWSNWPNHFSPGTATAPAHSPAKSCWQTLGEVLVRKLQSPHSGPGGKRIKGSRAPDCSASSFRKPAPIAPTEQSLRYIHSVEGRSV